MNRLAGTKLRISLGLMLAGLLLVALSLGADGLGLDLTPGFGLIQTLGLLVGLTLLTIAGYLVLGRRRPAGIKMTLLADVGVRLGLTGLLACYVAGLADVLGVGTHRGARFDRPFLGPLQLIGFLIGLTIVVVGLLLFWLGSPAKKQEGEGQNGPDESV